MVKKWTILIYANGNNEFEPEMYRLLQDCGKILPTGAINVLVQIGREKRELTKILRPCDTIEEVTDQWIGVRRYKQDYPRGMALLNDLGNVNMAHPKVLYDFLEWGIRNYSAEKYLLLIGGHSFQYLGIMTDYSQNLPHIMGIPELAKALNLVKENTKKNIDILVLDTCYMNMIEILYEFTKENNNAVKHILTYIEYGPIGGLPIEKLINIIVNNIEISDLNLLLTRIIEQLDFDLVAFKLNRKKLLKIKRLTNDLAKNILAQKETKNLSEIWNTKDSDVSWSQDIQSLRKNINGLVTYSRRVSNNKSDLVDLAHKSTANKLAVYYARLSFAKDNYWQKLLGLDLLRKESNLNENIQLKPLVLPFQALVSLIGVMNPGANEMEIKKIINNLLEYKKWQQFSTYKLK